MASGKKAAARERASGADGRAGRWKTRPGCRSLYRAFMIALVAWPSIAAPEMPERPWHVLILEAYDPWLPATIQLDQAMRRALHDDTHELCGSSASRQSSADTSHCVQQQQPRRCW